MDTQPATKSNWLAPASLAFGLIGALLLVLDEVVWSHAPENLQGLAFSAIEPRTIALLWIIAPVGYLCWLIAILLTALGVGRRAGTGKPASWGILLAGFAYLLDLMIFVGTLVHLVFFSGGHKKHHAKS